MIYELNTRKSFSLMDMLAKASGSRVVDGEMALPSSFGKGYIKAVELGSTMRLMICQCELTRKITLKIPAVKAKSDFITFSFRNVFLGSRAVNNAGSAIGKQASLLPSVQVSSGGMSLHMSFPSKTRINTLVINIHVGLLKDLINKKPGNDLLRRILSGKELFLYEEIVSPEIQNTATKMSAVNGLKELQDFNYKLLSQELIYLFFAELLKRKDAVNYPLNIADVKRIYAVRDKLISELNITPDLKELTGLALMSESKLNRLFKQIFGNTIYNYHQKLRMNEAALLIRDKNYSVSEAGYALGFSNLSHFTRIFERHIGLKPKKYSLLK